MTVIDKLHPERGGYSGEAPKLGVVVHTSEGGEGGISSTNLLTFLASPGDRPNGHGGFYGAGYNAVATETGGYVQIAGANRSPYHAPPFNYTWWSVCIPGKAGQTREQWLDAASRPYIAGVARFIVDVWHIDGEAWPLTLRRSDELLDGERGITSHDAVSKAWHLTDHWDPGPGFPWDVLLQDIAALLQPPPVPVPVPVPVPGVDDMAIKVFQPEDCKAEFIAYCDALGNALQIEWIETAKDQTRRDAYLATGAVTIDRGKRFPDGFRNCGLIGKIPTGDIVAWTEDMFAYRIPKTTG